MGLARPEQRATLEYRPGPPRPARPAISHGDRRSSHHLGTIIGLARRKTIQTPNVVPAGVIHTQIIHGEDQTSVRVCGVRAIPRHRIVGAPPTSPGCTQRGRAPVCPRPESSALRRTPDPRRGPQRVSNGAKWRRPRTLSLARRRRPRTPRTPTSVRDRAPPPTMPGTVPLPVPPPVPHRSTVPAATFQVSATRGAFPSMRARNLRRVDTILPLSWSARNLTPGSLRSDFRDASGITAPTA